MLKIIDGATATVNNIVAVVYGPPNLGKTTLALTASRPLLLDFDSGAHRAGNKAGKAIVPVETWKDVASMDAADLSEYDTVIVDTLGWALKRLADDIMAGDAKMRRGDQLTLQGYGALKGRFSKWLDTLVGYGRDVVIVAHGEEIQRGDETVDRIDAMGGAKQLVYQSADIMGRIYLSAENRRLLSFDPTRTSFGKNVGLDDYTLRPPTDTDRAYLAEIVDRAKELINQQSETQAKEVARLADLRAEIESYDPADALPWNRMLTSMMNGSVAKSDKAILLEVATTRGLTFDKAAKAFATAPDAQATGEAPF